MSRFSDNTIEKDSDGKINLLTDNTTKVHISNTAGGGKVGIGVNDPDSQLEVMATSTQQKWSYD